MREVLTRGIVRLRLPRGDGSDGNAGQGKPGARRCRGGTAVEFEHGLGASGRLCIRRVRRSAQFIGVAGVGRQSFGTAQALDDYAGRRGTNALGVGF